MPAWPRRSAALAAAIALAFTGATASTATASFGFIRAFGSGNGMQSAPGDLSSPQGTGFTPKSGHLYVADSVNDRVQEFLPKGPFLRLFGSTGSLDGQLSSPSGLGIDRAGDIYVSDGAQRVQEFSPSRVFIRS